MEAVRQAEGDDREDRDLEEDEEGSEEDEEGSEEEDEEDEQEDDGDGEEEQEDGETEQEGEGPHHTGVAGDADGPRLESPSTYGMSKPESQAAASSSRRPRSPPHLESDDEPALSPINGSRPLSRSPPASRHGSTSRSGSPSSLVERTASLSLSRNDRDVKERAAAEASRQRARQQRKYHSKRGAQKVGGRQKGSKAKQDTRIKADRGGFWD